MQLGENVLRMTGKERLVEFSWKANCFPVLERIWGQRDDWPTLTLTNANLAKTCCSWPEKSVLYNFHEKPHSFFFFARISGQCDYFWELWRSNMRFGQNVLRMTWKQRFCPIFMESALFFPFWRDFEASFPILRTLTVKNAIWPKRAAHDLKKGFVQFSWKAHCFAFLERIWGQYDDFDNFDAHKFDLAKTCCAWRETSVLYNFQEKRTVFPFWREFEASVTIFDNFDLDKCDLAKNVLRMTCKERFVQFLWKAHCFPVLKRIWDKSNDFEKFDPQNYDLGQNLLRMTWNERFVQFSWKAYCFPFLERIIGPCDDFENFDA